MYSEVKSHWFPEQRPDLKHTSWDCGTVLRKCCWGLQFSCHKSQWVKSCSCFSNCIPWSQTNVSFLGANIPPKSKLSDTENIGKCVPQENEAEHIPSHVTEVQLCRWQETSQQKWQSLCTHPSPSFLSSFPRTDCGEKKYQTYNGKRNYIKGQIWWRVRVLSTRDWRVDIRASLSEQDWWIQDKIIFRWLIPWRQCAKHLFPEAGAQFMNTRKHMPLARVYISE